MRVSGRRLPVLRSVSQHREVVESAHQQERVEGRGLVRADAEIGQPAQQCLERDLHLDAGERGAEAGVDAVAEGDMLRRSTGFLVRSNSSALSNCRLSRFADERTNRTLDPFGIFVPWISTSSDEHGGTIFDVPIVGVFRLHDDKIIEWYEYLDPTPFGAAYAASTA